MRLPKFLFLLIFITIGAIFYVSQQVEAVKVGYQINAQQLALSDALDQRQMLLYNVCNLKSPENLQESFCKESQDYRILGNKQIIVLTNTQEKQRRIQTVKKPLPRWLAMFGITSVAEARTQE